MAVSLPLTLQKAGHAFKGPFLYSRAVLKSLNRFSSSIRTEEAIKDAPYQRILENVQKYFTETFQFALFLQ